MSTYYFIFLLLLFASTCNAGPTIVIAGPASLDVAKTEFLNRYVPQSVVKNVGSFESDVVIFNRNEARDSLIPDTDSVQQIGGIQLERNVSTVVFTKSSLDELNTDELFVLENVLRTERSLYVVEFGKNDQKTPFWFDYADCWAKSEIESEVENTVYICNKETDSNLISLKTAKVPITKAILPTIRSSFFFVSAVNKKYRVDKNKMEEDLEDEIQDIVEETMKIVEKRKQDDDDDDDEDGNEFDNQHDPKRDHRLHCKYRKSCYETGNRGLIEPYDISFDHLFHFWRAPPSQQHHLPRTEDADQDGIPDSEDEDVDLVDRKLVCKYRTACYKEHNIPLSDKQQERERSFMSAKLQAPQGKKRTLKDIAQKAVSGVKEKEEEAKSRPVPKSLIVEKKLQEIENQLQKKLDCKYRKSCYETGDLPEIEKSSFSLPYFSSSDEKDDDDDDAEKKPFEEMEELEKKHFCKYRKSCYETGEKPDIESELAIESFNDIFDVPNVVETRKLTIQERCKYRKSCYETGILPDLSHDDEHIEKAIKKEVSSIVPSTVQDLKTLCKYRKSCYQEISEAPSADTIQTIRKRRLIEKEVRKRRTRRHRRLHRRRAMMSRYGMTTGSGTKYDKVEKTKKELQDIADARENRKDAPAPKSVKLHGKKKVVPVVEEEVVSKIVEEVAASPDDDDDEADREPEPEPPIKKNKKSSKKVKEPEPEEVEPVRKSKRSLKKVKARQTVQEPEIDDEKEDGEDEEKREESSKQAVEADSNDDEEDTSEDQETIPVPVPVTTKNHKKASKRQPEPEEEEKLQEVKDSTEENDDDDGNEFDNAHDPKRDHRLHCKYRKTCYETGKRGLIEPYDFSLWHIIHFWAAPKSQQHHNYGKHKDSDGDGIPDIEDKDTAMAHRKLSCKYRTSCYEDYGIPVEDRILEREQKKTVKDESAEQDDDDDDDQEERKVDLNAADKRLECKYRRSCYDSGVLPTIQQWSHAPSLSETIEISSKNMKMQKCKYRKSCYEAAGINEKEGDDADEEEKKPHLKKNLKPVDVSHDRHHHHHSKHGKKKHHEPKDSEEDDDDKEEEQEVKQKKNKEEKKQEDQSNQQTDKETLEQEEKELHLTVAEKSWCKYRKSCYSSVEPKSAKQDHSGAMARRAGSGQKCHIYYLSCREAMGLPPKEKAPIGPNGKRLCRKVKKDN